jgi:hypothetical protein
MSAADAVITVWRAKYVYGLWRPVTAINLADTDGNPATTADPTWAPLLTTRRIRNTPADTTWSPRPRPVAWSSCSTRSA